MALLGCVTSIHPSIYISISTYFCCGLLLRQARIATVETQFEHDADNVGAYGVAKLQQAYAQAQTLTKRGENIIVDELGFSNIFSSPLACVRGLATAISAIG